jgi:hypothetical protein
MLQILTSPLLAVIGGQEAGYGNVLPKACCEMDIHLCV